MEIKPHRDTDSMAPATPVFVTICGEEFKPGELAAFLGHYRNCDACQSDETIHP